MQPANRKSLGDSPPEEGGYDEDPSEASNGGSGPEYEV
jgi:hypothetical protein